VPQAIELLNDDVHLSVPRSKWKASKQLEIMQIACQRASCVDRDNHAIHSAVSEHSPPTILRGHGARGRRECSVQL
jgi:hypothetical protein